MVRASSLLLLLICGFAWAQANQTREYLLKYARAAELCRAFGGEVAAGQPLTLADEAAASAQTVLRSLPDTACQWVLEVRASNCGAVPSPDQTAAGPAPLQKILPPGLTGPPKALLDRNAVSATGTEDALKKLGEIIRLLDVAVGQVRFEVRVLDQSEVAKLNLGTDWNYTSANAPNVTAFARIKLDALPAELLRTAPVATLVLPTNCAGECTFREFYPHYEGVDGKLTPRVFYSALRVGLRPRINADKSVTFYLSADASTGLFRAGQTTPAFVNASWVQQARVQSETFLARLPRAQAGDATEQWLAAQPQLGMRHLQCPVLAITPTILNYTREIPTAKQ